MVGVSAPPLPPLLLASSSPRRRELLSYLGLPFETIAPDVDEVGLPGEDPADLVARLSELKAAAVARSHPAALVIAADTIVVLDDQILGKPVDTDENRVFLQRLSGRTHHVYTGHHVSLGGQSGSETVRTAVTFRDLTPELIEGYLRHGEGLDKAGGYALQGVGGVLVDGLQGCYTNVIGMSLPAVERLARRLGVHLV